MNYIHTTLQVKDMDESLKFYQEIVGLEISRQFDAGPDRKIVFLGDGETKIELIYSPENKTVDIGNDISIGFETESVDEMMAFVQEKGVAIHSGPFEPNPSTRFFYVQDPNGLRVQFAEHK